MKIIADENIPYVHEFFDRFGHVETHAGRTLSAEQLKNADVLLVRSVTNVNEKLLHQSRVKFVGTCTIGVDHLDKHYLDAQGIQFASAPGCNAGGVLQYDFAALAMLEPRWREKSVAIIGCGNVGGRVYSALKGLNVDCVVCDPFKTAALIPELVSLETALAADIVCMHTPYTTSGEFPTHHLINRESIQHIRPGALLLNAGRGGAIDNKALLERLNYDSSLRVVLDVWENEPGINRALLEKVNIGSPHIAGYSFEGKLNGTRMICQSLAEFLGKADDNFCSDMQKLSSRIMGAASPLVFANINQLISATYNILEDDKRLRLALENVDAQQGAVAFDALRKHYPQRREFEHFLVNASACAKSEAAALGFRSSND